MTQKARTRTQFRVLSKREGYNDPKEKLFASLKRAKDRIGILTSDEPWRFYGNESERQRDGGELLCCPGHYECGCGGATVAEEAAFRRKDLPKLEWVRLERRTITTTPWESEPQV